MGIGTSSETVELKGVGAAEAFERAPAAMAKAGKVIESVPGDFFIRGTTRYGLSKVRLKIHVLQSGDDSNVDIEGLADDVWGKGARSGIKRFRDALAG